MMRMRQLRDGRVRLILWHHIEPCPDDEARFDLILERSIPVIVLRETFANRSAPELVNLCVEMTLMAYALVTRQQADLPLWGTYVETAPGKYSLEEAASLWMRIFGRALRVWKVPAPRCHRKNAAAAKRLIRSQ